MQAARLNALTKDFKTGFWRPRPVRALDGVTLDVEQGEALAYLGPNGAGKTTTLKLLLQLIFATSGSAEILGRPAGDVEVRRRVGFLPEAPRFPGTLSAEELLTHHARLFGFHSAEARRRGALALDRVGIGGRRRSRLREYSRGMVQRVGIALALVNDPDVILLDEPLSGLDPVGRRDLRTLLLALRGEGRTLLLALRGEGRTLLFSSHLLPDAEAVCSRVAILNRGRLVATTRIADLQAEGGGWQLVVEGIAPAELASLDSPPLAVVVDDRGRQHIDLPADRPPERIMPELVRRGARIVSLAPRRQTLEEFFVAHVAGRGAGRAA